MLVCSIFVSTILVANPQGFTELYDGGWFLFFEVCEYTVEFARSQFIVVPVLAKRRRRADSSIRFHFIVVLFYWLFNRSRLAGISISCIFIGAPIVFISFRQRVTVKRKRTRRLT